LPGRSDDWERVTCAKESLPEHSYSSGGLSRYADEAGVYVDAPLLR
jgi:hypothetical protein